MYTINYFLANGDKLDDGETIQECYNELEEFGSLTHKLKCENGQLKRTMEIINGQLETKNRENEELKKKLTLENSLEFSVPEEVTTRNYTFLYKIINQLGFLKKGNTGGSLIETLYKQHHFFICVAYRSRPRKIFNFSKKIDPL